MKTNRLMTVLTIALAILAAGLRIGNLRNVNSRTPDEKIYTYQAQTVLSSGAAGMRGLVSEYKNDAEMKLYPPPTRAGMIRLLAWYMRVSGTKDESAGAVISCAASLGSVAILAILGIRFFSGWAAVAGMLFYAVFPGALAIARRTWTDALVEFAGLVLIWCMCEVVRGSKGRFWWAAMPVAGGLALAVKESVPVLYFLCLVPVVAALWRAGRKSELWMFLGATAAALALALAWLADQTGSFADYINIVLAIPAVNAANEYALEYASGPRYLMLEAFWIAAPVTSLCAIAGVATALGEKWSARTWLAAFVVAYVGIAMAMPHWINLRYVGNTFGAVCLLAGLGCVYLVESAMNRIGGSEKRAVAVVAIAIVAGASVGDYLRFRRYFVRDEIMDLSIKMLVDERNQ